MEKYAFFMQRYSYDELDDLLAFPKSPHKHDLRNQKTEALIILILSRYPKIRYNKYINTTQICGNCFYYDRKYKVCNKCTNNLIVLAEKIIKTFALPKMIDICVLLKKMGLVKDVIHYIINCIPLMIKIDV